MQLRSTDKAELDTVTCTHFINPALIINCSGKCFTMNTVAQAKSGERTRFWIADHTNRSAIITLITQNLALIRIRVVTEQEGAEELCLKQEEEWELHCRHLHLLLPPSPGNT